MTFNTIVLISNQELKCSVTHHLLSDVHELLSKYLPAIW